MVARAGACCTAAPRKRSAPATATRTEPAGSKHKLGLVHERLHRAGRSEGAIEELKRAVTAFAAIGSDGDALYPGVWTLVEW